MHARRHSKLNMQNSWRGFNTWKNSSSKNQFSRLFFSWFFLAKTWSKLKKNTPRILSLLSCFCLKCLLFKEGKKLFSRGTWNLAHSNWKMRSAIKKPTTKVFVGLQDRTLGPILSTNLIQNPTIHILD